MTATLMAYAELKESKILLDFILTKASSFGVFVVVVFRMDLLQHN